jgi:hypothetical protein
VPGLGNGEAIFVLPQAAAPGGNGGPSVELVSLADGPLTTDANATLRNAGGGEVGHWWSRRHGRAGAGARESQLLGQPDVDTAGTCPSLQAAAPESADGMINATTRGPDSIIQMDPATER